MSSAPSYDVGESIRVSFTGAPGQLFDWVGLFRCFKICNHIPVRHVAAAARQYGCLNFGIGNRWEIEHAKNRLNCLGCAPANRKRLRLANGPQPAVHLHVPLQNIVVVQILCIEIATTKQVVFPGH